MWFFFEDGTFYSAVVDRDDEDVMMVRARDRRSADILSEATGAEVLQWPSRDYAYRVIITREQWDEYVHEKIMNAKATNFKSEVGKNVGHGSEFVHALHEVWQVMYNFQGRTKRIEASAADDTGDLFRSVEDTWDEHPGLAAKYGLPPF